MGVDNLIMDEATKDVNFDKRMSILKERQNKLETSIKYFEELLGGVETRAPPKTNTQENIPRILYHGTCYKYFYERISENGEYHHIHGWGNVWLDNSVVSAASYAIQRAKQCHDDPLLIVVDIKKLQHKIKSTGLWEVEALNIGSFEVYQPFEFIFDYEGKFSEKNLERIKRHETFLLTSNEEKLLQSYFRGVRNFLKYLDHL